MVTFTCQSCSSCLKKKAVELHLHKCRNPQLTCIDCLKDFDRQSYSSHLTCVTESERYGGQGFVPSNSKLKQNDWYKCITDVSHRSDLNPPDLKIILKYAAEHQTCPRNKKKFVNFILNNKAYNKYRSLAETAFDLISEEFNKRNVNSNNVSNDNKPHTNGNTENFNGKRKTISETEAQEEIENNLNEKTSKEKNKKLNGHAEQNNIAENNHTHDKKKKKKNKKNSESRENEPEVLEDETKCEKVINSAIAVTTLSKKKKNKHRKNSTQDESFTEITCENTEHNVCEDEQQNVNGERIISGNDNELNGKEFSKLSKKERKKLLKQKKYEAEIVSIKNYKKEDEVEENVDNEKRKKKKNKHQVVDDDEFNRKQKSSISEPDDKKIKLEDGEDETEVPEIIEKPKKFKWDEVIIQVLQTQDDGEMSLKRLSKKICAEYANVYGERESYEEVLFKFNKKVLKTQGVRVFKDKAKLLTGF